MAEHVRPAAYYSALTSPAFFSTVSTAVIAVRACASMVAPRGVRDERRGRSGQPGEDPSVGLALRDSLSRLNESRPLTPAELANLSRLLVRVVATSEALLDYARRVAGRPCPN